MPGRRSDSHENSTTSALRCAGQVREGDRRAFEAIYRRYHQQLYRFCVSMVGNPEDAQEALQNTMVKVLRSLPGERRQIDLKPWLYRIARNEAVETLRKRRRRGRAVGASMQAVSPEIAATVADRERLRRLFADLRELPDRQRDALVMRELAGLSFVEIGGCPGDDAGSGPADRLRGPTQPARAGGGAERCAVRRRPACSPTATAGSGGGATCEPICGPVRPAAGSARRSSSGARTSRRWRRFPRRPRSAFCTASAGRVGAGAGKAVAGSALAKTAAGVAVVAAIGVSAADREGLIELTPGGGGSGAVRAASPGGSDNSRSGAALHGPPGAAAARLRPNRSTRPAKKAIGERAAARRGTNRVGDGSETQPAGEAEHPPALARHAGHPAHSKQLPAAAAHGQATATAHKAPAANRSPGDGGRSRSGESPSRPPSPPRAPPPQTESPPGASGGPSGRIGNAGGAGEGDTCPIRLREAPDRSCVHAFQQQRAVAAPRRNAGRRRNDEV